VLALLSSLDFNATSVTGLLSGSYSASSHVGLTLNLGYGLDRSDRLVKSKLAPVQRFAVGISDVSHGLAGLGVETDWSLSPGVGVGPFAEVTSAFGIGARLRNDPIRATVGSKVRLFGADRIELSVGGDFALSGKATAAGSDMAGIAPWTVFARVTGHLRSLIVTPPRAPTPAASCVSGAECASGTTCRDGICTVVQVEQVFKTPATYKIAGKVTSRTTNALVDSAIVTIAGYETTPLAVNRTTGEYVSFALPCGEGVVQLTAVADGYRRVQKVVPKGADQEIKIANFSMLSSTEKLTAELRGSLKDSLNGKPVTGTIFLPVLNLNIKTDEAGRFQATVDPGHYEVLVTAPRHVTQKKEIVLHGGDSVILNVDLVARGR